jgi:hypothetical protein
MSYRFTDHSKRTIVNTETGAVLEWNPVTNTIVSDHGFAVEDYRRAGSPTPAPFEAVAVTPDDFARRVRRGAGDDRRRAG